MYVSLTVSNHGVRPCDHYVASGGSVHGVRLSSDVATLWTPASPGPPRHQASLPAAGGHHDPHTSHITWDTSHMAQTSINKIIRYNTTLKSTLTLVLKFTLQWGCLPLPILFNLVPSALFIYLLYYRFFSAFNQQQFCNSCTTQLAAPGQPWTWNWPHGGTPAHKHCTR